MSLNGSPTVSPTTAALWVSLPFAAEVAGFDILFRVVPRAAGVGHEDRHEHTRSERADEKAGEEVLVPETGDATGIRTAIRPGDDHAS